MVKPENNIKKIKLHSYTKAFITIGIVILINILFQYIYFRLDLTQDKRFRLGKPSKELLHKIDDKIYVRVYLEGDLPSGFRKLKESTMQLLDELRLTSGKKLEYDFIDPLEAKNAEDKQNIYNQLIEQGLEPVNLEVITEGKKTEKIIFPGAIIYYKNLYIPIKLLQQQIGVSPEQVIHHSIINLEYNFISAIRKLSKPKKQSIAIIQGHGELDERATYDIFNSLKEFYNVERIDLPKYKVGILDHFDLIIIAKPDSFFSELEKYKIDQFVMKGGKVVWLVESLLAEMDSLGTTGNTTTLDYNLNLNDMLFRYGVRLNYDLVQDMQCHLIPLILNQGTPQRDFRPWIYFPVVFPTSTYPIVNNLNAILFQFTNSIDTVGNKNLKKTVLLTSSKDSRLIYHPATISLAETSQQPDIQLFNKGSQILSVLIEGKFTSLFKNRLSPGTLQSDEYGKFRSESPLNKMVFVSDGDIIANQFSRIKDENYPLGYDRFTNQTFGNKTFILNVVDYLIDDSEIMTLRSKDFRLRMLDKTKIKREKTKWQFINLVLPVIVIIVAGYVFNSYRKNKYAKRKKNES